MNDFSFLKTLRWMRIASNEVPLKREELLNLYLTEECESYCTQTNYFYQMTFLSELFASRNNDVRDQQWFYIHFGPLSLNFYKSN